MKDIVVPAQIYKNKRNKKTPNVSSPSFKHLRFDFFNMRIPTRFGILAFKNPTQIGELHEITIKSWMEATSLQPSIPMVWVKKMLRLPSLKLTKFAKNGWDHRSPAATPIFGPFFFCFRLFFRGETPPSRAHRPCSCGCVPWGETSTPKVKGLTFGGGHGEIPVDEWRWYSLQNWRWILLRFWFESF